MENPEDCKKIIDSDGNGGDGSFSSSPVAVEEIEEDIELEEIWVQEGTTQLYKLLASCDLTSYFKKFIDEDFNDNVIMVMDPRNLYLISTILPKIGSQIKFGDALEKAPMLFFKY